VWLKAENLQRTGSFKIRGASNKLAMLSGAERAAGVVAASAGNHGQAVARAARELGVKATVYMPLDAPMAKVDATRSYGAETVLAGAGFDEALAEAWEQARETGATFVHAFEDDAVIAGQGTIGLELLDDRIDVSDDEIADAITLLLERAKLVVEGAGATTVAAILAGKAGGEGGVCALLSGGNIDPTLLISVMRHGLALAGRYLIVRTLIDDRPGALVELLQLVAAERGNVLSVEHHREGTDVHVAQTGVELTVITRNEDHCSRLCSALKGRGYVLDRVS